MHSGCDCLAESGQNTTTQIGALERPRYSPGLVLEASDLTAAVDYTRDLNRLLFKSLFGCGVICGLDVSVKTDCDLVVTVNPGLALDGCGDPINLTGQAQIKLGKKTGVLVADATVPPQCKDFWVVACYKEKSCAPRALVCDCDDLDGGTQTTLIRSAVEISVLFEPPACACDCGTFTKKQSADDLEMLAQNLRTCQTGRGGASTIAPKTAGAATTSCACETGCHDAQYNNPSCPADCGCGTACSCGCCVLLAWVHWFPGGDVPGWTALHHGVRRFVRPALICEPKWDFDQAAQMQEVSFATADEGRIKQVIASLVRTSAANGADVSKLDGAAIAKAVAERVLEMSPALIKSEVAKINPPDPAKPA